MNKRITFGDFMLCYLWNLLFDLKGTIPCIVLIVLHFAIGLNILYAALAFVLWLIAVLVRAFIVAFGNKYSKWVPFDNPNKNPYSARTSDYMPDKKED